MAQREPTAAEKLFFIERGLVAQRRAQLIEQVAEFIRDEYPSASPDGFAIETQEFIEECLEGTGWELRGEIDYEIKENDPE